jgi:hypothetical protein
MAAVAAILDLISVGYLTNAWVDWSDFFVGNWGVTGGRFLSVISAATHSRWPPHQPSWIWFPSTNASVDWSDFFVAYGGKWSKVPFDDQRRRSFKMAAAAAILDLVPINYLTNCWVNWSGVFCGSFG